MMAAKLRTFPIIKLLIFYLMLLIMNVAHRTLIQSLIFDIDIKIQQLENVQIGMLRITGSSTYINLD